MQKDTSTETVKSLSKVIKINEHQFKDHIGKMVRSTVEETLNDMLDAEADQLCNAKRYERTGTRTGGRGKKGGCHLFRVLFFISAYFVIYYSFLVLLN